MAESSERGSHGGPLTPDEVSRLSGHMAGLSASGLPLGPGLRAAAEELPGGRLRDTLNALADALESGASLDEVVDSAGDRLPGHLRGLVRVGAKSGRLGESLSRFVAYLKVGVELRRRLWVTLAYPVMLLVTSFALFSFVCGTVVTQFENIFKDFGVPLPTMTVVLIQLSHVFGSTWRSAAELAVGVVVLLLLARFLMGATGRGMISSVPVLGSVSRNTSLAEFCHLLGLLLESHVPMGEAVRLTGDGVQNAALGRACHVMGADIDAGAPLSQALAVQPLFPRGLARVIHWAEGHQSLPGSLHMAGEMFEARAQSQATFAGTVLSVIAVIAVVVGVGWLVIGLFLPLITLVSKLSG